MPITDSMEHGALRLDIYDDEDKVVISIVEDRNRGAVEINAIILDYQTARMLAHYILEHV
jgi:hypothetical protein